jgi:hypothetical protein
LGATLVAPNAISAKHPAISGISSLKTALEGASKETFAAPLLSGKSMVEFMWIWRPKPVETPESGRIKTEAGRKTQGRA